ncbi:MAG: hypothetical protein AAF694_00720 [Bacteroidota bacterium]
MRYRKIVLVSLLVWIGQSATSQVLSDYLGNEQVLYAETKQVNQFFRRFNGEEDTRGNRYYPGNSKYRDIRERQRYLPILFDLQNPSLPDSLKKRFIRDLTRTSQPGFLDFYGEGWFAEVIANFTYQNRPHSATLFLKLQKEPVGFKWVFSQVYFEPFASMFVEQDSLDGIPPFIHPQSHELDFMTLRKVFQDSRKVELYASKEYHPDHLTLLLYELKKGNITFNSVKKVKFHFVQIKDWYFELSEINRRGPNRGWLISQLVRIPEAQKNILLKYIYHE